MTLTAEGKERLDRFVARKMPEHSRVRLAEAIKGGLVTVGREIVTKPSFELRPGDAVSVGELPATPAHDLSPFNFPLDVRYEDDDLLVVIKPRGMVSHPGYGTGNQTLVNALLARSHGLSREGGAWRPGIVHRLDKETTGLMVVAKNDAAHRSLAAQIKAKSAIRLYVTRVFGELELAKFVVNAPIGRHPGIPSMMTVKQGGREATTHFFLVPPRPAPREGDCDEVTGGSVVPAVYPSTELRMTAGAMLICRLETGRTHQIRVHLSSIGHPVKGDKVYAKKPWNDGPLQLHAAVLSFDQPSTGTRVTVYAEPPEDFAGRELVTQTEIEKCL